MLRIHRSLLLAATLSLAGACNGDGTGDSGASGDSGTDTASATECLDLGYEVTWGSFGEGFLSTYCDSCHAADSPNRFGAPDAVTFDTLEETIDWQERIRVRTLEDQDMPVGGGVYDDDLFLLEVWMDCGLPE